MGIGGVASKIKRRSDDIQQHWRGFIHDLVREGLLEADPGEPGGYSYFMRGLALEPRSGNAFVIGDAAGLATRDMCEGIGPAVASCW